MSTFFFISKKKYYRWSLTYNGLTYGFLTLQWCKSSMHSVKTTLLILILDLFPGNVWCNRLSYAEQPRIGQLPVSPTIARADYPRVCDHSTQPFWVSLSAFNKWHELVNTLWYNRLYVKLPPLLLANVSVLSKRKVGEAKPMDVR